MTDLDKANKLLTAVREALESADEILATTTDWTDDPPPLLKQNYSWKEAVDPKTFDQFEKLTAFLVNALFGIDCDHDSAVRFQMVNLNKEENFLPQMTVPRTNFRSSLSKRYRQYEVAKIILSCVQSRVETMERCLDHDLKSLIEKTSKGNDDE